jgi:branched-chain amino acid transport system ATP-binding protein
VGIGGRRGGWHTLPKILWPWGGPWGPNPRVLLLDEPSMGLAPILVEDIFRTVQEINQEGTTVLLVEQNALMALSVCDRGYVLETGTVALEGTVGELRENPQVKAAYLAEG